MRVAYFTAGDVGAGHLVRGLAIGRALGRLGFPGQYRIFGPDLPFSEILPTGYQRVSLKDAVELRHPSTAQDSELFRKLRDYAPDLILVDLFWAPLRYLLQPLSTPAWLLLRLCPDKWLVGPSFAPFEPTLFDRIFAIEPADFAVETEDLDPLVICNPDEAQPEGSLQQKLGLAPDEPVDVFVHAGLPQEAQELTDSANGSGVHRLTLDLFDKQAIFPAAEWLGDARRIVCGAGYNTFWETHWLGREKKTEFHAFPRRIDDQALRLSAFRGLRPTANGADVLASHILAG